MAKNILKFHWICQVTTRHSVLFAKRGSPLTILNMEQAKLLGGIGVIHGGNRQTYLENHGFINLEAVKDESLNIRKLMAGRIDLVFMSELEAAANVEKAGYALEDLEPKLTVYSNDSYIYSITGCYKTCTTQNISWYNRKSGCSYSSFFYKFPPRYSIVISL